MDSIAITLEPMAPKRLRYLLSICLTLSALLLASCSNPISGLLVTKGAKEKEVAAVRADYAAKMATLRQETETATKQLLEAKDAQIAGAATAFYGQDVVFRSIHSPTRTDLLTHNLSKEGWQALGRAQPSYEAMQKMNERLQRELDASKTSLADLEQSHAKAMTENQALAAATKAFEAKIAAIEAKSVALEREFTAKLDKATGELVAAQNQLIAAEKARSDDAAALQELKTKFSVILGIAALAGIAAAIYLPIFRQECGIFGAVCGLAAYGIWLIQPWHVGAVVAVAVVGIAGWMAMKHQRKERGFDALVLANQDVKETNPDVWKSTLGPAVADRLSRYHKTKSGKLVAERDPSLERHIDETLAAYDALPVKTSSSTT